MTVLMMIGILITGATIGMFVTALMITSSDKNAYREGYEQGRLDEKKRILDGLQKKFGFVDMSENNTDIVE